MDGRDAAEPRGGGPTPAGEKGPLDPEETEVGRALSELLALGSALGCATDLDQLVVELATRVRNAVDAACCDVFRTVDDRLECLASVDREGADKSVVGRCLDPALYPFTHQAVESGRIAVLPDVNAARLAGDELRVLRRYGFLSEVCVPLMIGERLVGLIEVYSERPRSYAESLDYLHGVASITAGMLHQALLLRQADRRELLGRRFNELGMLVARQVEPVRVYQCAADVLCELSGAVRAELVHREAAGRLSLLAASPEQAGSEPLSSLLLNDPAWPLSAASEHLTVVSPRDLPRLAATAHDALSSEGITGILTAPLVVQGELAGQGLVFFAGVPPPNDLADVVGAVSRVTAGVLLGDELRRDLEARSREQRGLVELGIALADTHDVDMLARLLAQYVTQTLDVADCDVWRLEDDVLRCLASFDEDGFDEEVVGHQMHLQYYPLTQAALEARDELMLSATDPRLTPDEREPYERCGFASSASLPLQVGGDLLGWVDIYDRRDRDWDAELDAVRTACRMMAGAFESAELLRKLDRTNSDLRAVVQAGLRFGSSLHPQPVVEAIAREMQQVASPAWCDILLYEGDGLRMLVSLDGEEAVGDPGGRTWSCSEYYLVPDERSLTTPVEVFDVEADRRVSPAERDDFRRRGLRSALLLPLIASGRPIGQAVLMDAGPRRFDRIETLQLLAQQAAQALYNVSLHEEIRAAAERLALVAETGLELNESLDLRRVLTVAAVRLQVLLKARDCEIWVRDGEEMVCLMSVEEGVVDDDWTGRRERLDDWPTWAALIDRGGAGLISHEQLGLSAREREILEATGERSVLLVPLVARGVTIGSIEVASADAERVFGADDVKLAEAMSGVVALAVDNAGLFADLRERSEEAELVNEVAARAAASLDTGEVGRSALEALARVIPFDRASIVQLGPQGCLQTFASSGTRISALDGLEPAMLGPWLTGMLREGEPFVLDVPDGVPPGLRDRVPDDVRSAAVMPLCTEGEPIGAIVLASVEPMAYASLDRRLLARFARHLALATRNARLYAQIKSLHLGTLKTLSAALGTKDYYTLGHAGRTAGYTRLLGAELGWPDETIRAASEAAFLHDIGKISLSDRLLQKPGRLTDEEWSLIRAHPVMSADIIGPLFCDEIVRGVRHHHERYDGNGYPDGLAGTGIPEGARALAVADAYDAMSFSRPYRELRDYPQARAELERCSGSQFDPQMVAAFLRVLDRLEHRRDLADQVARLAAATVDPAQHGTLRVAADETAPAYRSIAASLRAVRDAHPPTRFITTCIAGVHGFHLVVDCEESRALHAPIGTPIVPDESKLHLIAGESVELNVLSSDELGVWVSGYAPVEDERGHIVALVVADLPPDDQAWRPDDAVLPANDISVMARAATSRVARAEVEAISDPLTGLYNHRYFQDRLQEEIGRARDEETQLTVLFIDIDDFKRFNDEHGHLAGDQALKSVARVLERCTRRVDVVARYGGEEFAVVLLGGDATRGLEVAGRIRERVAGVGLGPDGRSHLTVSVGLATCPVDGTRRDEIIDKADWAMYRAKRCGKDCVRAFMERDIGPPAAAGEA